MGCSTDCGTENIENKEYQDLSEWKGITLKELLSRLEGQSRDEVRVYTVATTRLDKSTNIIRHLGSGPNLEGGLATLCTCKHSMRQNRAENWKGQWILGLTSRAANKGFNGEHYLLYLMKVDQAFESHKELFEYLNTTDRAALRIKNAVNNRLGDIFEPADICKDPLNHQMYKIPHKNHSHIGNDGWHDDIAYNGKSAPLLLGAIQNTFVWQQPMIRFNLKRGAGNMKLTLGEDLFSRLESNE